MNLPNDLALALDVCLLFEKALGEKPDPWQRELLTCPDPRIVACCGRGTGKSASTAILAAHHALFVPNSLTVVGSPSENVSKELGRAIFKAIKVVDSELVSENESRIELRSGSRVVCLPASQNTRGLHSRELLLIIDEAQLLPPEMYSVLEPFMSVARRPKMILLGTPRARLGKFWEYYSGGNFKTFKVRSDQCPRISKEFLAAQLLNLGPHEYKTEYEAEFQDPTDAMFDSDLIDACAAPIEQWEI
jgi:hypothetical protein